MGRVSILRAAQNHSQRIVPARVPQKGHVFHSSWRGCLQLMQLRLRSVSQNGQTTKSYWTILEQAGQIDSVLLDTSITRSNSSSVVMPALALLRPSSPKVVILAERAARRSSCSEASAEIISRIRAVGSRISIMAIRPKYPVFPHSLQPFPA